MRSPAGIRALLSSFPPFTDRQEDMLTLPPDQLVNIIESLCVELAKKIVDFFDAISKDLADKTSVES